MKRIVIKVGSHVLTENGAIAKPRMLALVQLIAELKTHHYEVILVSSGAVSAGYTQLPLDRSIVANKQALAAIGQPYLLKMYQEKFAKFNLLCSQVLLSADVFGEPHHISHAKVAVDTLLKNNVVPIINENDISSAPDQIYGDNDLLAARVTHHTNSDLLVILSDIDGYYDSNPSENPNANILKEVNSISEDELTEVYRPHNQFTAGGMFTKLVAAEFLINKKREMYLCSGFDLSAAYEYLMEGKHTKGTLFRAKN